MDRPHERILGTVLVVVGVGLLLFAVDQAYLHIGDLNPSSTKTPNAAFTWNVAGLTVTFTDRSTAGSYAIASTYWSFGDGNSTYAANTSHTYAAAGTYNVTLEVEDSQGNLVLSNGQVQVATGASSTGAGSPSVGANSISGALGSLGLGTSIASLTSTAELFIFLGVFLIAGGSILRAGWNLITPKAETIQVRVKPRDLQVEPVTPMPMTAPSAAPMSGGGMPSGVSTTASPRGSS